MKQDAITYEFGDGGLHDNSGFLALVQRKASRVVPRLARDSPAKGDEAAEAGKRRVR